jgi:hypothetical protein
MRVDVAIHVGVTLAGVAGPPTIDWPGRLGGGEKNNWHEEHR